MRNEKYAKALTP